MMRDTFLAMLIVLSSCAGAGAGVFDKLADPETSPYRLVGKGIITDSGHPVRPGAFRQVDVAVRLSVNPQLGEATIELESADGEEKKRCSAR